MCRLDLVQFTGINVDMDDTRIGTECCDFARGAVIEAHASGDQEVAGFQRHVGIARRMHAQHADGARMIHGDSPESHQRHGRRNAAFSARRVGQGRSAGMDHAAANVQDGPGGGVDQRRRPRQYLSASKAGAGSGRPGSGQPWNSTTWFWTSLGTSTSTGPGRPDAAIRNAPE